METAGEWSFLIAPSLGIPPVRLRSRHGVLGDIAKCAADFRDQYYGLAPYVIESSSHADPSAFAPLITSGLISPAELRWARRPTRFNKARWLAPAIDLAALGADPRLAAWARGRLQPKVLVATQGRVIEAVVDERGQWLPSVPTITAQVDPARLWHVLAVLLSPPVAAYAAARYAGTGLTMNAIKLSAKQVATLPLPAQRRPGTTRPSSQIGSGRRTTSARGRRSCVPWQH
jgi:hypothetical protein